MVPGTKKINIAAAWRSAAKGKQLVCKISACKKNEKLFRLLGSSFLNVNRTLDILYSTKIENDQDSKQLNLLNLCQSNLARVARFGTSDADLPCQYRRKLP